MSTTNFNQPTTPSPYGAGGNNNSNNDGQKRLLTMAGIAIALLLGTTIYLAVSKYKTGQELSSLEMNFEQQKAALVDVETKFNAAIAELEQSKGLNAELDAKINEQINELTAQKSQIDQLIKDKKDYRVALGRLEGQKKEYLAQIEQLKEQVGILTTANTELTAEKEQLTTSLTETQMQLQQEGQAKAALISEKTELQTQNTTLAKKADRGSAIDVMNLKATPIDVRGSKEKTKSRAKKVDKVNICFRTEANEVTDAGEETFYIVIIDPTGSPLLNEALGSGVAVDKKADAQFRYTTTATTSYNNEETDLCGAWLPGANFVKGKYNVEIYNKGYRVGQTTFSLK